jgi:hypothetical protein
MHRGDRFKASVVAFGFMALLLLSPAGAVLDRLSSGLGEHAGWAWIGLAMIVFWATYFTFRAVRLRRERSELLPPERAPD